MATAFEEKQTKALEQEALAAVRTEYAKHFEAIAKPARLLVGQEVPSLTGPGMERLRDSADAQDWQNTVKQLLAEEVASRVEKRKDGMRDVFAVVHSSIDLFRNNHDLIPGTRSFDKELADKLTESLKDYELRSNGKLIGYSVPVQPIVNAVRASLVASRAAAAAAPPAAPAPASQGGAAAPAGAPPTATAVSPASEQPRDAQGRWEAPQAGIPTRAGQSSDGKEDIAAGVLSAFFRQNGLTI